MNDDANSLDSSDDELDAPLPPKSPSPPLVLQKRRGSIHPPALEALEGDAPEGLRQGSFLARRRGGPDNDDRLPPIVAAAPALPPRSPPPAALRMASPPRVRSPEAGLFGSSARTNFH